MVSWLTFKGANRLRALALITWVLAGLNFGMTPELSTIHAASLEARLNTETTHVNESVTLTIRIRDASSEPAARPDIKAIATAVYTFKDQSRQFVREGDQHSWTYTYEYDLNPRQAGEMVIPPIEAEVDGETLRSDSIRLTVLEPESQSPGEAFADELAFLILKLPKRKVYVQEFIPAQIHLFVSDSARVENNEPFQLDAEGFTQGQTSDVEERFTQVAGKTFKEFAFSIPVAPVKAGELALGPVTCGLTLRISSASRRSYFNKVVTRFLPLKSKQVTLQALPLPGDNVPPRFNGAVGEFTLRTSASPTNTAVGDPVTVQIEISGRGNLENLRLPDQSHWEKFRFYPASAELNTTDQSGLEGSKHFEWVVVPQTAAIRELPPIEFSFFSPEHREYRTLSGPSIPLAVRPGPDSNEKPMVYPDRREFADLQSPPAGLVHIKPHLGTLAEIHPPLIQRTWFLSIQSVPLLAWVGVALWRKQLNRLAKNPRLQRKREVGRRVRAGLRELDQLARQQDAPSFYATVFRLLQESLGERLDLPASAITEDVLKERLPRLGVDAQTVSLFEELFQTCNQARYAPQSHSSQELTALIPKLESALNNLPRSAS